MSRPRRFKHPNETRERMSAAHTGHFVSLETRAKISAAGMGNQNRLKHGHKRRGQCSSTYRTWCSMRRRCDDLNYRSYKNYGGRGITYCIGLKELVGFLAVMGKRPKGKTIDRIDNDGNYSCGICEECLRKGWIRNIRWATRNEQQQNRRQSQYRKEGKKWVAYSRVLVKP